LRQRWISAATEGRVIDIQADLMCYPVDVKAGWHLAARSIP